MKEKYVGLRRLEYFGWNFLTAIVFALPCAWLEGENAPSKVIPYLFVYGLYGFFTGLLIEKRAKNIGFAFYESVWMNYEEKPWLEKLVGDSGMRLGPVTGITIALFLLLGFVIWTGVTGQYSESPILIFASILLLMSSVAAIPVSLYLLFAPEDYKQSHGISGERKKLEKELKGIQEANEVERLKEEIKRLKAETP